MFACVCNLVFKAGQEAIRIPPSMKPYGAVEMPKVLMDLPDRHGTVNRIPWAKLDPQVGGLQAGRVGGA